MVRGGSSSKEEAEDAGEKGEALCSDTVTVYLVPEPWGRSRSPWGRASREGRAGGLALQGQDRTGPDRTVQDRFSKWTLGTATHTWPSHCTALHCLFEALGGPQWRSR